MRKKGAPIQQAAENLDLQITLQDVVDGVEDDLLVIDSEYRIRFANSAARDRFPQAVESLIGRLCYEALHERDKPCSAPLWDCPLTEILQSGHTSTTIHPTPTLGAETYLKITAYPLRDSHGNTKAVIELRRDVTAERELEAQILRRHHQLSALSHISSAVSGLQDLDTILRITLDNVLDLISGIRAVGTGRYFPPAFAYVTANWPEGETR